MNKDYVLVTGGLGFIGSHTVVTLIENGYNVIIIDNLSNSSIEVFDNIKKICNIKNNDNLNLIFYNIDVNDLDNLDNIFSKHRITSIIHFAAFKSVAESIKYPLLYYQNNICTTLNILNLCEKYKIKYLIFSSSATVYGNNISPLLESSTIGKGITHPYGYTKYFIEQILNDVSKSNFFTKVIILRYFNPVGAHPSGLIGENPNGIPNNLMPFISKVVVKNNINSNMSDTYSELKIYGNDYNTLDGTAVRDFIHVVDLASAHVKSIEYLINNNDINFEIFNVGTGKGTSVLDMVNCFKKVNNVKIPYEFYPKRAGDIDFTYCNNNKIYKLLKWNADKSLEDICKDTYNFILMQSKK
jgi:UDP-glucose 4-epimerase